MVSLTMTRQPPVSSPQLHGGHAFASNYMNLSFYDMQIGPDGNVLGREQIKEMRLRQGFCLECRSVPIRLYQIKTSRFNPLWTSKVPLTVEGECINGQCLICKPELDPNRRKSRHRPKKAEEPNRIPPSRGQYLPDPIISRSAPSSESRRSERNRLEAEDDSPMTGRRGSSTNESRRLDTVAAEHVHIPKLDESFEEEENNQSNSSASASVTDGDMDDLEEMYNRCRATSCYRSLRQSSFHADPNLNGASENDNRSSTVLPEPSTALNYSQSPRQADLTAVTSLESDEAIQAEINRFHQKYTTTTHAHREEQARQHLPTRTPAQHLLPTQGVRTLPEASLPIGASRHNGTSLPMEVSRNTPDFETIVVELEFLIKDLSVAGSPDFTSDVIVNAMKFYPMAEQVQIFCLGTIWDLCKDNDDYKVSFISTSAPDDILVAMTNHMASPLVQERGCGALWSLSFTHHNRIILARAGALARIVRAIMIHKTDKSVVCTGIGALRTLSPEAEVRETLLALQATQRVAEAMELHRSVACIQRDGCAFLSNSVVDLDKHQVSMATEKEVRVILDAMKFHPEEPSVISGACFALKNYTYEECNLQILASFADAVGILDHAAHHSYESNSRRDAKCVLERLLSTSMEHEDSPEEQACTSMINLVQQQIVPANAVEKILEVMKEHEMSVNLTAGGLRSLLALATLPNSDMHRSRINDSALKRVIACMRRHEGDDAVQVSACGLLEVMASYELKCRYSIFDGQGCIAIVNAMRQHTGNISVQVAACAALRALSIEFECWFELEKSGNAAVVQEAMIGHPESAMLQQLVSEILTNFSSHSDMMSSTS